MVSKRILAEVLIDLRRRLDQLPARAAQRRDMMQQAATLYGISESALYRQLGALYRPKAGCNLNLIMALRINDLRQQK